MAGFVVHVGASLICGHGGQAQPATPNPRVMVSGQPVVTLSSAFTVAGCPNPPNAGGPCVSANFIAGAVRVFASGQPVLLNDSPSLSSPTPLALTVTAVQTRVRGS